MTVIYLLNYYLYRMRRIHVLIICCVCTWSMVPGYEVVKQFKFVNTKLTKLSLIYNTGYWLLQDSLRIEQSSLSLSTSNGFAIRDCKRPWGWPPIRKYIPNESNLSFLTSIPEANFLKSGTRRRIMASYTDTQTVFKNRQKGLNLRSNSLLGLQQYLT